MGNNRSAGTRSRIRNRLDARKWARSKTGVLCVLGALVTLGVAGLLMQNVMAKKTTTRVLDCHVSEVVAHHHNADCYDEQGELVCTLPERELHTHDKSCYERQLVCGKEEAEPHKHTDKCYDADGKLICGLEETEGHKHTDECYADVLVCGKEEVTQEHVHGDGCFHTVAVGDDADQTPMPERAFFDDVKDADGASVMSVSVASPEGALPEGTTMELSLVDPETLDRNVLQTAIDDKAAKSETLEPGKLLDFQAVDITFRDSEGISIEPKKSVTVTLSSSLIEKKDASVIMHLSDAKPDEATRTAEVVDHLGDKQLARRNMNLGEAQMAFETSSFSTYLIASVSCEQELVSSNDAGTAVSLKAGAEAGIPADAILEVVEVGRAEQDYDSYLERTTEATDIDKDDVGLARFFDITITDAEGAEIQPAAPVDVEIRIPDIPADPTDFKLVHFAEDENGEQTEAPEELAAGGEGGTTTFTAESFSVYGVVYTVDFGYQVDDKVYEFSIQGGGAISMAEVVERLHVFENAAKKYNTPETFVAGIDKVEFSNTELVLPTIVDERASVGHIVNELGVSLSYSAGLTQDDIEKIVATEYEHEWILLSLKPFDTTEALTITMTDGTTYTIKVTDDQGDVPADYHGGAWVVDTIVNPGNTTIDLFDYWVSYDPETAAVQHRTKRELWEGHHWGSDYQYDKYDGLSGRGNWQGINANHDFKFTPANDGTVWNGTDHSHSNRDKNGMVNSYTGNADPVQGLVSKQLVNGFPQLSDSKNAGTESLKYLFDYTDANSGTPGKRVYRDVDKLLYLDTKDGYYTYDSRDVNATFVPDGYGSGTFTEKRWGNESGEARGFWPFGDGNWWLGMHVNTQFLMPEGGQVADKSGNLNPMEFKFSGDDDAWVYIDGVLIGDGGGIHNRTEIDINFKTGDVIVTGLKDPAHKGSVNQQTNLRDLFVAAGKDQAYIDANFTGNTFNANSTHSFDFFYIERGGGESNLYLRYNLLTTTDFQARKRYISEDPANHQLSQDQFSFLLLGMDGRVTEAGDGIIPGTENEAAIMPYAPESGSGTANDPSLIHDTYTIDDGAGGSVSLPMSVFRTGNRADGTVTFGTAQISEELKSNLNDYLDGVPGATQPKYRYIVMENVPPNAINANGVTWGRANLQERLAGGFYDGETLYDGTVYYMECRLVREQAVDGQGTPMTDSQGRPIWEYKLERTFFTNAYFTEEAPVTPNDIEFTNSYIEPVWIDVVKADSKDSTKVLQGAKFRFGFARYDETSQTWASADTISGTLESDASGRINIDTPMPPGQYLLTETEAPANYKMPDYMWLVEMVNSGALDPSDPDYDATTPHIIPYITRLTLTGKVAPGATRQRLSVTQGSHGGNNNVHTLQGTFPNEKVEDFRLTVQKQWEQIQGDDDALEDSQIQVILGRYTLDKRFATIRVYKSGVPAGSSMISFYVIQKVDPDTGALTTIDTLVGRSWPGDTDTNGVLVGEIPFSVQDGETAQIRVTELVYQEDGAYAVVHNQGVANPQEFNLSEGQTGDAKFTADYTMQTSHVYLTSELLDSRTENTDAIDTSQVMYTLYDDLGTAVAGPVSFDEVTDTTNANYVAGKGYDLGEWPAGRYTIVESGWPYMSQARTIFSHTTGNSGGTCAFQLNANADPTIAFTTQYLDYVPTTIELVAYEHGNHLGNITTVGTFTRPGYEGMTQIEFMVKPGTTDYNNVADLGVTNSVFAGNAIDQMDYRITWPDGVPDGTDPDTPVRARIVFSHDNSVNLTIYIGTNSPVDPADVTDASASAFNMFGMSSMSRSASRSAAAGPAAGEATDASELLASMADGDGEVAIEFAQNDEQTLPDTASLRGTMDKAQAELDEQLAQEGDDGIVAKSVVEGDTVNVITTQEGVEALEQALASAGTSRSRSAAKSLMGAGALRSAANGIQPGNLRILLFWNSTDGPGTPPENTTDATFVPDQLFNNARHTITLTQDDFDSGTGFWQKSVIDADEYPAFNDDNEKYYYYIQEVIETGMPTGTTGQILTDSTDETKQRLAWFIDPVDDDNDPDTPDVVPDPQHLAVSNKVAQPADVKLYKVDEDDNAVLLAGAKFHLQKKDDRSQWQNVTSPTLSALDAGETVNLDATTGIFEVPEHGVKIEGLLIGEYRLVEDECPPGYTMSVTEYTFKVNQGGQLTDVDSNFVYDDSVDPLALFVPNPPGAELPHAGGPGTTPFLVAGAAIMAVGAMMLLKRRREA